jgi:dihydrolipoamide dehydrogenase
MGTKVTVVEFLPRIVPVEDEEISKELEKIYKKYGIEVLTSSEVTSVDTSGNGVKGKGENPTGEVTLEADILLSAIGISANIENIGLETLGVKTDKGKITVDKYYQTNVPGIYSVGDCVPGQALAHVSTKEGYHLRRKYRLPGKEICPPARGARLWQRPRLYLLHTGDRLRRADRKQARDAGYEIKVGKFPLTASGKATGVGHTEGFVKVVFDAKYGEWLGTHMIGYNVTEIIIETVLGRKLETTYHEVLDSIHPHPTISEAVKDAIEAAYGEAIHL